MVSSISPKMRTSLARLRSSTAAASVYSAVSGPRAYQFAGRCLQRRRPDYKETTYPKEVPIAANVAVGAGYTESKWVAERLLEIAAERNVVQSVVIRIGQLSGGVNGAWKLSEWLPSMICASAALGCLPQGQGVSLYVCLLRTDKTNKDAGHLLAPSRHMRGHHR